MESKIKDVIVIGAGPAGYAAAIYTSRAKLDTLVLAGEQAGGQLMWTTNVENYPGFKEGILGPRLMEETRAQAERFGAEIMNVDVTRVNLDSEVKKIYVGDKLFETKTVIIATGAKARMLGLGEERWFGRGVSTCAVCDAAFFKNKTVAVIGGGDAAMEDALALAKFASRVYIIHRRSEFRASKIMQERVLSDPKIEVRWNTEVMEVRGDNLVRSVNLKDSENGTEADLQIDGLFLAVGHVPTSELWKNVVDLDEKGYIKTAMVYRGGMELWRDEYPTQTSVKAVFAAGDVVDFRYRQAITAAAMGVQAALDVEKFLALY